MSSVIQLSEKNAIWTLTLNRPEALNALNSELLSELDKTLSLIAQKSYSEAKVLIITGSGEKAFVAGADIKEMSGLSTADAKKFAERGQKIFRQLENLKIPVIAAVNGFALGGGLELALSCDFIYASEKARFGLPEVSLGLIPGFGGTVRLSRVVGLARAREIIFSGDMLDSAEALRVGIANKVFASNELMAAAMKSAETMASRGPVAVGLAKKSILASYDMDVQAALGFEATQFSELFNTQDVREGTGAFVEKRKAQFKGV